MTQSFAYENELHIEIGENYNLKERFTKVWIENKKIIDIDHKGTAYFIKTLKPGTTHFRLDNNLYKIFVSPIGSKKSYSEWQKLVSEFKDVYADYCENLVCLKGNLSDINEYERIVSLIEEKQSPTYLALNVDSKLREPLQKKINEFIRNKGTTALKIVLEHPWKVYSSQIQPHDVNSFMKLGLLFEKNSEITEIKDNIKVAVKVVEMSKNFEHKIGIRWPDSYQAQMINPNGLTWADSFDLAISAAEKSGEAKVLASPNLICRNGKEADFFAGGEFPIKIVGLRSNHIEWKRYGIALKLKPKIDPLGQISLQIESEVSTIDRSITVDDVPAIHSNKVSSHFDLIDSRTIALSGLLKNEQSESAEGLPYLKNIPILGSLFSSKNFQENKSELVIFVTPELMTE